jgi:hypothetical protein
VTSFLYLDIETIPDWDRFDSFGLDLPTPISERIPPVVGAGSLPHFDSFSTVDDWSRLLKSCTPPAEWLAEAVRFENERKTPRKGVLTAINDAANATLLAENAFHADESALNKKLSVTPEFLRIVSIGMAINDGEIQTLTTKTAAESMLLESLWELVGAGCQIVGYNVIGFDLPAILTRSILLDVAPTRRVNLSPYGNPDVVDLMLARFGRLGNGTIGLKQLARSHGIEIPAGDCNGFQVYDFYQAGDWGSIERYQASDIQITRELHTRMRGYFCD